MKMMNTLQNRPRRFFFYWLTINLLGPAFTAGLVYALPELKAISTPVAGFFIIGLPTGFVQWWLLRRLFPLSWLWVLTIPAGVSLYYLVMIALPDGLWQVVDDESAATLTSLFCLLGALIGLPQWAVLRSQLARPVFWIAGSAAGVGGGFGLVLFTGLINQAEIPAYAVVALVYSLVTGAFLLWLLPGPETAGRPHIHPA